MAMFDKLKKLADQAKEKAGPLAEQAAQKASELAAEAKEKAGPLAEQAKEKASDLASKAAPAVAQGVDKAADGIDKATEGPLHRPAGQGPGRDPQTAASKVGGTSAQRQGCRRRRPTHRAAQPRHGSRRPAATRSTTPRRSRPTRRTTGSDAVPGHRPVLGRCPPGGWPGQRDRRRRRP